MLELLVVLAIVAVAAAGVGIALRDPTQARLEREALRLAALLEAARAQAQIQAQAVRWYVTADGFRFDPPLTQTEPGALTRWLDPGTRGRVEASQVVGATEVMATPATPVSTREDSVVLGPEAIIDPQTVLLYAASQPQQLLRLSTDGVRPFTVQRGAP